METKFIPFRWGAAGPLADHPTEPALAPARFCDLSKLGQTSDSHPFYSTMFKPTMDSGTLNSSCCKLVEVER